MYLKIFYIIIVAPPNEQQNFLIFSQVEGGATKWLFPAILAFFLIHSLCLRMRQSTCSSIMIVLKIFRDMCVVRERKKILLMCTHKAHQQTHKNWVLT